MKTNRTARRTWSARGRALGLACFVAAMMAPCWSAGQEKVDDARSTSSPHLVGVGSCTAAGCHGGGRADRVLGSEYNVWISQDPHARAYSVLFDERSQRMVRQLNRLPADASVAAEKEPRCLACHSQIDPNDPDLRPEIVSDGVGCEACHGPAEGWLAEHYGGGRGGTRLSAAQRQALGLWDTDSLLARTQICTGCHVGGRGRDVNHDLIAAGHPRLEFEMSAYLAAMPKHWDESADRARWGANFDAAVWAIGQAVASQAALGQLAERADRGATWPEFAEWSCSACHHDLRDDAARQSRLAETGGLSGRVMPWDTWNHRTMRYHAADIGQAFGLDSDSATRIEAALKSLDAQMGRLDPDRKPVESEARDAAVLLNDWAAALERGQFGRPGLDRLSQAIVSRQLEAGVADWSSAAQTYDALANLQQSRLDAAPGTSADLTAAIRKLYEDLAAKRRAPAGYVFRPDQIEKWLMEVRAELPATEGKP